MGEYLPPRLLTFLQSIYIEAKILGYERYFNKRSNNEELFHAVKIYHKNLVKEEPM